MPIESTFYCCLHLCLKKRPTEYGRSQSKLKFVKVLDSSFLSLEALPLSLSLSVPRSACGRQGVWAVYRNYFLVVSSDEFKWLRPGCSLCKTLNTHTHTHTHTQTDRQTDTPSVYMYTYVYMYTCIHVYTYTCIHVYMYTRIHTYTRIHVYTYTKLRIHVYKARYVCKDAYQQRAQTDRRDWHGHAGQKLMCRERTWQLPKEVGDRAGEDRV
jgi:hypothetical protein